MPDPQIGASGADGRMTPSIKILNNCNSPSSFLINNIYIYTLKPFYLTTREITVALFVYLAPILRDICFFWHSSLCQVIIYIRQLSRIVPGRLFQTSARYIHRNIHGSIEAHRITLLHSLARFAKKPSVHQAARLPVVPSRFTLVPRTPSAKSPRRPAYLPEGQSQRGSTDD